MSLRLTNANGKFAWPAKGNALNTWLGSAQSFTLKRIVP